MKSILFTFLVCILSVQISNAQWVQVSNGMGNIEVRSFTYIGNNLFAATDNGVYLSTNNGTSWTQTPLISQLIPSIAANGNNVYAGINSGYGVYKSTNNGTTWTQTSLNNETVPSLAVNGNNIFAGTLGPGVYVSNDSGTTWTQTPLNNQNVLGLAVNGNNVFAGTALPDNGVYLSTNNGTTWTQTPLNNQFVRSLALYGNYIFAGTDPNGVYLSTNNGTTWTQTSLNNRNVRSLTVNGNYIFAGTHAYGVYVSNDNGTSWTRRIEGFPVSTTVWGLCILNNYIFAGTFNGVYRRPLGELTDIQPISEQVPAHYALEQNYPNPFNPVTIINFQLPMFNYVKLNVYDVLGKEVEILVNQQLKPGTYEVEWDVLNVPSGVYFYQLSVGNYSETKKMILLK